MSKWKVKIEFSDIPEEEFQKIINEITDLATMLDVETHVHVGEEDE